MIEEVPDAVTVPPAGGPDKRRVSVVVHRLLFIYVQNDEIRKKMRKGRTSGTSPKHGIYL